MIRFIYGSALKKLGFFSQAESSPIVACYDPCP